MIWKGATAWETSHNFIVYALFIMLSLFYFQNCVLSVRLNFCIDTSWNITCHMSNVCT